MIPIVRSFRREVVAALPPALPVTAIAALAYGEHRYDLLRATWPATLAPDAPTLLLSAGVHGDEPAGVFALTAFLAEVAQAAGAPLGGLQLVAYPCVNPSGFEAGTLETMGGANLNRAFKDPAPPPEVAAITADLAALGLTYRLFLDMHEAPPGYEGEGWGVADNPHGCWLYESQRDPARRLGRRAIDALPPDLPPCTWPTIYGDANAGGVVDFFPETSGNAVYAQATTFDGHVYGRFTDHAIVAESPTGWALERRIAFHRHVLATALAGLTQG